MTDVEVRIKRRREEYLQVPMKRAKARRQGLSTGRQSLSDCVNGCVDASDFEQPQIATPADATIDVLMNVLLVAINLLVWDFD